jgi:hypothetical protein
MNLCASIGADDGYALILKEKTSINYTPLLVLSDAFSR